MQFVILINAAPFASQASDAAFYFAKAALAKGHCIAQVFFYQDGVYNGSCLHCPPQDEPDLTQSWQKLATQHAITLNLCAAAALRRGILDKEEAKRYEKAVDNIADPFQLAGLGQLITAIEQTDRLIVFG